MNLCIHILWIIGHAYFLQTNHKWNPTTCYIQLQCSKIAWSWHWTSGLKQCFCFTSGFFERIFFLFFQCRIKLLKNTLKWICSKCDMLFYYISSQKVRISHIFVRKPYKIWEIPMFLILLFVDNTQIDSVHCIVDVVSHFNWVWFNVMIILVEFFDDLLNFKVFNRKKRFFDSSIWIPLRNDTVLNFPNSALFMGKTAPYFSSLFLKFIG